MFPRARAYTKIILYLNMEDGNYIITCVLYTVEYCMSNTYEFTFMNIYILCTYMYSRIYLYIIVFITERERKLFIYRYYN